MKLIVIEGDTLIIMTPEQLYWVNGVIVKNEILETRARSLNLMVGKQSLNILKFTNANERLLSKNNQLLVDYSNLIKLNETNDKLIGYYKKETKIQRRKKIAGTVGGFTIGVGTGALIVALLKSNK